MSQPVVTPGEYSLTEVAERFNVSRKTAERYVPRYKLETKTVVRFNKPVQGVILTEEIIEKILTDNQTSQPVLTHVQTQAGQDKDTDESGKEDGKASDQKSMEWWLDREAILQERIDNLQLTVQTLKEENARLSERITAKDETIDILRKDAQRQENLLIQATNSNTNIQNFMEKVIDKMSLPVQPPPQTLEYGPIGLASKPFATQPQQESQEQTKTIDLVAERPKKPAWKFW